MASIAGIGAALSAAGASLRPINLRMEEEQAKEKERQRVRAEDAPFAVARRVILAQSVADNPDANAVQEAIAVLNRSSSPRDAMTISVGIETLNRARQKATDRRILAPQASYAPEITSGAPSVSLPAAQQAAKGATPENMASGVSSFLTPMIQSQGDQFRGIAPQVPELRVPGVNPSPTPQVASPRVTAPIAGTLRTPTVTAPSLATLTTEELLQLSPAARATLEAQEARSRADEDRARTVANQKKQDDARAWLGSAEGIALLDRATKPQRDRNGSLMYDEAAQIQFAQRWRDAGYTTNPPLPESKIFAPQQRQIPRDNETEKLAILSRMVDDQGNFIPAAMQLAQLWGVNLGGQQPAQGLTAEVLIAQAKAELNKPTASNAEIASVIRSDISNASAEDRPIYDAALRSLESQGSPVGTEGEQPQKSIGDLQRELNDAKIKHLDAWNRLQRLGGKTGRWGGSNALPGETAQAYEDRELRRRAVQREQEELQSQIQSLQEQIRTYRTTAARLRRVRQIEYGR